MQRDRAANIKNFQDARERAAQAIAKAQNVSIEEARKQVQQYEQQYRETVDQAKQEGNSSCRRGR